MFNENSTLAEIIKDENGKKVLKECGVPCISCSLVAEEAEFLKIGEVADTYRLDKEKIIKELNKK